MIQVSTIIPAFNAAQSIEAAINSALSQTAVSSEIIVVDDGSTDETAKVLKGFEDAISVVPQENRGTAAARNRGAKVARGDWIAFLDADDRWLPGKLAAQLETADETIGLVYTNCRNFGNVERLKELTSDLHSPCDGGLFLALLMQNFITTSSVIMRRECFEEAGGFDEEIYGCEDWDLWLRFAASGGKARCCREPLTEYRWSDMSVTSNHVRLAKNRIAVVQRALNSARGKQLKHRDVRCALASTWKCSAWFAAPQLPRSALWWLLRAAAHCPLDLEIHKQFVKCLLRIS